MAQITREELIKLAQTSNIELPENEINQVLEKVTAVLEYAERVRQLAQVDDAQAESLKNINIFRKDEAIVCQPERILARGPEVEEDYFVVPKIIKQS